MLRGKLFIISKHVVECRSLNRQNFLSVVGKSKSWDLDEWFVKLCLQSCVLAISDSCSLRHELVIHSKRRLVGPMPVSGFLLRMRRVLPIRILLN